MQFVVNEEGALSHQRVENEEPGVYHELWQVVVRGVAHDQVVYFQCPCGRIPVSPEHLWTLVGPLLLFLQVLSSWGAFPISGPKFSEQK